MRELGMDLLTDLLFTLLSAAGAVGFTAAGVFVDRAGLQALQAGSTAQGAWELWMGTLAIFVGLYLLGYRTALPSIASFR